MKNRDIFLFAFPALLVVLLVLTANRASGQKDGMTMNSLNMPLEYYPGGNIKTRLTADTAKVSPSGAEVNGIGMKYEMLLEDGRVNVVVFADECRYDKANGSAESESKVRIEKEGAVITGKGFSLDSKGEKVVIKNDVRVVLQKGFKFEKEQK